MTLFLIGELYDISQLKTKKKIRILVSSFKNSKGEEQDIIDFDDNIQKQLIKKASKNDETFNIKSCKPYTFYEKYDRLIVSSTVSNKTSGLFFLDESNIGRPFNAFLSVRKYSFTEKKTGDMIVGWNMMLKKINPMQSIV